LLLPHFAALGNAAAQDSGQVSLVRIDPGGESGLAGLASLDLTVYEQLYTPDGALFLIAAAGPQTQAALAALGYKLSVLDPDTRGHSYSLLYGAAEHLEQAREISSVLLVEGSLAIARTIPEQLAGLVALGLDVAPLPPGGPLAALPEARAVSLPAAITPDPLVQEMIAQMDSQALYDTLGGLSGEWPVIVNGEPYTFMTRNTESGVPITKATRYTFDFLESLGLTTWYDYYYGGEFRNVIAQQTGLTQPGRIYLLTAHLDSTAVNYNPQIWAPGADDNASGSTALLHIAEILAQYDFGCTLRYALFTGEEQGLHGSTTYAADVFNAGEDLRAVLNLDMLGYNSPGTAPTFELHTRPGNSNDLAIAYLFRDAIQAYGVPLTPLILQDGKTFSDHSPFWNRGYPAVLAIEDWNDHTPFYHTTNDQLESLNFSYYTEFARAALATFAHMGCLLEGQLSGTVTDSVSSAPIPGATVEAWQDGMKVRSTTTLPNGSYQLPLQPGSYVINVLAHDHITSIYPGTGISHGLTTPLDADLTPCTFIHDTALSASPNYPGVGEMVYFTATVGGGETPISFSWDFGDGTGASGPTTSHSYAERGGYLTRLTASNACGFPQTVSAAVFVDVDLSFLPITMNADAP
jgi:hypothetical protein